MKCLSESKFNDICCNEAITDNIYESLPECHCPELTVKLGKAEKTFEKILKETNDHRIVKLIEKYKEV